MFIPESKEKTQVTPDSKATIFCPVCNVQKTISVENFKEKHHELRVRCRCGHSFTLELEFRKYVRKETSLPGDYSLEDHSVIESGHTRVIDLSIKGACFEVRHPHDITTGMEGELVFTLDNRKQSILYRQVIVRSVRGSRIGCEFLEINSSSKELNSYMMAGYP